MFHSNKKMITILRVRVSCWIYPLLVVTGMLSSNLAAEQPVPDAKSAESVWIWSQRCAGQQRLAVTIYRFGKVLYRDHLPICRSTRNQENGHVEFRYPIRSSNSGEGTLWQAGGEEDALLLGFSFTGTKLYLNTLYVARPDRKTSGKVGKGFSIMTTPYSVR